MDELNEASSAAYEQVDINLAKGSVTVGNALLTKDGKIEAVKDDVRMFEPEESNEVIHD